MDQHALQQSTAGKVTTKTGTTLPRTLGAGGFFFFQFVIHDGLKKTAKKKNSGTLPKGYFIVHVVTS